MDKWLYFCVFDGNIEVLVCCVEEQILCMEGLVELDQFLAYYGQNYKIRKSDSATPAHTCENMKCVRTHIIDANIKR